MKGNFLYIILNSAALSIAVLVISGIATLLVWAVLGLVLMALKLAKHIPDYRIPLPGVRRDHAALRCPKPENDRIICLSLREKWKACLMAVIVFPADRMH